MTEKIKQTENSAGTLTVLVLCFAAAVIMLRFPSVFSSGAKDGLKLCSEVMIPSMYPFLVISSFLVRSAALDFLGKKSDKIFRKLFGFSGKCGSIFLVSLLSGFPVGGKLVSSFLDREEISKNDAQRLMMCSVNAGPAFVISAVGSSMLGSTKAGVIIFISLTFSSLLIAFASRFFTDNRNFSEKLLEHKNENLSSAFVNSVADATSSMLSVSGWVIIFSCVCAAVDSVGMSQTQSAVIRGILEVTVGCEKASSLGNVPLIAAVIGWSGICVHFQVFSAVIKSGMKKRLFFVSKLIHGLLSAVICSFLLKIFPCTITVFSTSDSFAFSNFSVSAPAAAGLLVMSAILISDLETNRKVC